MLCPWFRALWSDDTLCEPSHVSLLTPFVLSLQHTHIHTYTREYVCLCGGLMRVFTVTSVLNLLTSKVSILSLFSALSADVIVQPEIMSRSKVLSVFVKTSSSLCYFRRSELCTKRTVASISTTQTSGTFIF